MPYGTIKIDTITFTDGGVDKSVPVSGLVQNPTFTGNVTVTGTISGNIIQGGTTVSGVTITGTTVSTTTGNFTSLTGTTATITSGIIASGTAALPSLAILSDPNTGIYSPGADQLAVATNGTARLYIASDGKIGVGTTSPLSPLVVSNGSNKNIEFQPGSTCYLLAYDRTASDYLDLDITAENLIFSTNNGTERLRITSAGLVGIGTSDPTSGTSSYYDDLVVRNATSGTGAGITIQSNSTNGFSGLNLRKADGTDLGKLVTDSSNGKLYIETAGSAAITVDTSQRVGIGTTSPGAPLDVVGNADTVVLSSNATNSTTKEAKIQCRHYTNAEENLMLLYGFSTSTDNAVVLGGGSGNQNAATTVRFFTAADTTTTSGSERARIDSSGRLLVGTSSAAGADNTTLPAILVSSASSAAGGRGIQCVHYGGTTDSASSFIGLRRSRGTVADNYTSVQNGDALGAHLFYGSDGSGWVPAASIAAYVDSTPGANDMPGRLVFSTTVDGGSSPTEQMRIGNQGTVFFGTTAEVPSTANVVGATFYRREGLLSITRDGGEALSVNRKTSDGNLVVFHQDGTVEGTITVSGTTVSYNGAHLSRWSQLPSGVERTEILRGSVLSNIDEMCKWGEEENEQLNRMKVSDVEGDKNVSGVFQAWDDDDDTYTNDFYCAMTGDFIIRIAEGTTVERGDLLMSAGDGTAKPQDDDIIRSKTVAKVTSTNVTCTYEDGSYCVPCVLMAC